MLNRVKTILPLLTILWMGVVFCFSHTPSLESTSQSDAVIVWISSAVGVDLPQVVVRKSAHFLLYFVLGILVFLTFKVHKNQSKTATLAGVSVLFCALYALSDEFHQLFISGRSAEMADVLLDTVASICGILLMAFIIKHRHKRSKLKS